MKLRKAVDILDVIAFWILLWWFVSGTSPALLTHNNGHPCIEVSVTAYRPQKQFTDSSPNWTSVGVPALMGICAASQDMLADGSVKYGDVLDVPGLGIYKVMDCMNQRHKRHIDILVYTKTQEKICGWRKHQMVKVLR